MSIVSASMLQSQLPTGSNAQKAADAVNRASRLLNTWAIHYEAFADYITTGEGANVVEVIRSPEEIAFMCTEVAKAVYCMSIGQIYRDGEEQDSWQKLIDNYKKQLENISIEPTIHTLVIALDTNGVMLIARNAHILTRHPKCKVESALGKVWNQDCHWQIRRGSASDREFADGWYFDAASFKTEIEGTLTYTQSWRNDSLDYLRYQRSEVVASNDSARLRNGQTIGSQSMYGAW